MRYTKQGVGMLQYQSRARSQIEWIELWKSWKVDKRGRRRKAGQVGKNKG